MNNINSIIKNYNSKDFEIECRFFDFNKKVSFQSFDKLKTFFSNQNKLTKHNPQNSRNITYKHKQNNNEVRAIVSLNKPVVFQIKKVLKKLDLNEFNMRIAVSKETNISLTTNEINMYYVPTFVREKQRHSFSNSNFSVDLTIVLSKKPNDIVFEKTYEIELEFFTNNVLTIKKMINQILQIIQQSPIVTTEKFRNSLLNDYSKLIQMRFPKFIGPLPFTINKKQYEDKILSCNYSVTDKADGERKLLYINKNGEAILISRELNKTIYIGKTSVSLSNSLFDGELVKNSFYIFDALFYKNKDLRSLDLYKRLETLSFLQNTQSASMKNVNLNFNLSVSLKCKKFYFQLSEKEGIYEVFKGGSKKTKYESIYDAAGNIWTDKKQPYELDGLIFTPVISPYISNGIFKWKPVDTFDFYVRKQDIKQPGMTYEVWELNIAGFTMNGQDYQHFNFKGLNGRGLFTYKKFGKLESIVNNIPQGYGMIKVNNSIAKQFQTNSVVEFKFTNNTFIPIATRQDKTHANGILAVLDAWNATNNPITLSMFKKDMQKFCGRKFHNAIKNELIQKWCKNKNVLDFGPGAGGNISKYKTANIKSLVGVNIVPIQYPIDTRTMKFFVVKNELYNVPKLTSSKQFDVCTCFFAVHYFFKNNDTLNNFYNNVNNSLNAGGYLVMTCLDGEKVKKLNNYESKVFAIKRLGKNSKKIEVNLKGTKYFEKSQSIEYIVDLKLLMQTFKNFKLEKQVSFSEIKNKPEFLYMSPEEQKYSFLNQVLILKKNHE